MKKFLFAIFFIWKCAQHSKDLWKNSGSVWKFFLVHVLCHFGCPWVCQGSRIPEYFMIEEQLACGTYTGCLKTCIRYVYIFNPYVRRYRVHLAALFGYIFWKTTKIVKMMNFEHLRVAKSLEKYIYYLLKIVSLVKNTRKPVHQTCKVDHSELQVWVGLTCPTLTPGRTCWGWRKNSRQFFL